MAPRLIVVDRPTALDHKLAEVCGVYLCEDCGKELMYPANPQLCGRCEEKRGDDWRVRSVIADQWYRVDKADATLLAVNALTVARAAADSFANPVEVVNVGRFQTAFAIYSQGKHLAEVEKRVRQ